MEFISVSALYRKVAADGRVQDILNRIGVRNRRDGAVGEYCIEKQPGIFFLFGRGREGTCKGNLPASRKEDGAPNILGSRGVYRFRQLVSSPGRSRKETNLIDSLSVVGDDRMFSVSRPPALFRS